MRWCGARAMAQQAGGACGGSVARAACVGCGRSEISIPLSSFRSPARGSLPGRGTCAGRPRPAIGVRRDRRCRGLRFSQRALHTAFGRSVHLPPFFKTSPSSSLSVRLTASRRVSPRWPLARAGEEGGGCGVVVAVLALTGARRRRAHVAAPPLPAAGLTTLARTPRGGSLARRRLVLALHLALPPSANYNGLALVCAASLCAPAPRQLLLSLFSWPSVRLAIACAPARADTRGPACARAMRRVDSTAASSFSLFFLSNPPLSSLSHCPVVALCHAAHMPLTCTRHSQQKEYTPRVDALRPAAPLFSSCLPAWALLLPRLFSAFVASATSHSGTLVNNAPPPRTIVTTLSRGRDHLPHPPRNGRLFAHCELRTSRFPFSFFLLLPLYSCSLRCKACKLCLALAPCASPAIFCTTFTLRAAAC